MNQHFTVITIPLSSTHIENLCIMFNFYIGECNLATIPVYTWAKIQGGGFYWKGASIGENTGNHIVEEVISSQFISGQVQKKIKPFCDAILHFCF